MSLPSHLAAGTHLLFLTSSLVDRLSLVERIVSSAAGRGRRLVVVSNPELRSVFETAVRLARVPGRQVVLRTVKELAGEEGGWRDVVAAIDAAVTESERSVSGWRLDEPESETLVYVDLDSVFDVCDAASEMMSIVYGLHQSHAEQRRCVIESISIDRVPRSIPSDFFDVHTDWVFSPEAVPGADDGRSLDQSALRVALETPEFRHQFLALARTDPESATRLVPRLFRDYRRGFLLVDHRLIVRHCSARAAALLGRSAEELIDRPLSSCIDGVDFLTLRHECLRASNGVHDPFVVSWRLAPGNYEPREVTVDAVTSEHRSTGYVISLSTCQTVRGPRSAYRQLASAGPEGGVPNVGDDPLSVEDSLSDSLHGTQITRREHEVLLLILNEHSNRDIARTLDIAEVTVKKHLTSIYRKLRITNRSELIRSFAAPHAEGPARGRST